MSKNANSGISMTQTLNENTSYEDSKKNLRIEFLEARILYMETHIKDLEQTLKINKEFLSDVISTSKLDLISKMALEKLQEENQLLLSQLSKVIKERDEIQAFHFTNSKIICKNTKGEKELNQEFEAISDELDRVKFELETVKSKYNTAKKLLEKFNKDSSVEKFLSEMKDEIPRTLSNVIEEKKELEKELISAKRQINELEMSHYDLSTLNTKLKLFMNEVKLFGPSAYTININKALIPTLDFSKIKNGQKQISDSFLSDFSRSGAGKFKQAAGEKEADVIVLTLCSFNTGSIFD